MQAILMASNQVMLQTHLLENNPLHDSSMVDINLCDFRSLKWSIPSIVIIESFQLL